MLQSLEDRRVLASFTVITPGDGGNGSCNASGCTLRDAVLVANAVAGADEIVFDSSITGTISLSPTNGELLVTDAVSINGPGSGVLTVRAGTSATNNFRIINASETSGDVTIEGLTLTNGRVPLDAGGAIRFASDGLLTVRSSVISGNTANNGGAIYSPAEGSIEIISSSVSGNTASYGGGGAIDISDGDTTITSSTISNNRAFNSGGGVYSRYDGTITITDSQLNDNRVTELGFYGGAVASNEGAVTISGSTLSGNTVDGVGGGVYNGGGGLAISGSTFSNNEAEYSGGGIFNYQGPLTIASSTISDNVSVYGDGGGISNGTGRITLTDSTISGNNSVTDGGGVSNNSGQFNAIGSTFSGNTSGGDGGAIATISGGVTLTNSTVSDNAANVRGGGIQSDSAAVRVVNTTIASNTAGIEGGGIAVLANNNGESILIHNTIVASNTSPSGPDFNAPALATSLEVKSSLIGDNSQTTLAAATPDADGNFIGTAASPINPQLQPLAANGGPTMTRGLSFSSPAVDRGDNALAVDFGPDGAPGGTDNVTLVSDQRGGLYSRYSNSGIGLTTDIGAFELQPKPTLIVDSNADVVNGDFSPGDRTLRELIQLANESDGFDTVLFSGAFASTITLDPALGPLVITESINIVGTGADQLSIEKDPAQTFRLIDITSTAVDVRISDLSLVGGNAGTDDGGAIRSQATGGLTLVRTELLNNSAASGGAIAASSGDVAVAGSTIANNTASGSGGGIALTGTAASISMVDSTLSSNTATLSGGGIYSENSDVIVANSTITLNTSGTIGGGIGVQADGGGESLNIDNSIIAGNSAANADDFNAPVGAGTLDVDFSLIGDNDGTTLTESTVTDDVPDADASGNLIGGGTNPTIDPLLEALASNGGPTMTHNLMAGSLAIDSGTVTFLPGDTFDIDGDNNTAEFLPVDQRGATRVVDGLDMGALELAPIPTITWADPDDITFGTALDETQLNASSSAAGTFEYTPAADTVLPIGDGQLLTAVFTPSDPLAFRPATATASIDVLRGDPVITWEDPEPIVFGTLLGVDQLNAMADIAGTFVYDPESGTALNAGAGQVLSVTFTPDDSNYNNATATVTIDVLKADPVITWTDPADIEAGIALDETQLNATADVTGTFVYDPIVGTVLDPGEDQTLSVTFTPDDGANYNTVMASVSINVLASKDFGDAPSQYPVLLADDGARHSEGSLSLGETIDTEGDGQPSAAADGDGDDDDGVTAIAGAVAVSGTETTSSFAILASGTGRLDAWIDFNGDGDWSDTGEQIATDVSVAAGENTLTYVVPADAVAGSTAARFRISTAGGLAPTGEAADGEVEDYIVSLLDGSATPDLSITLPLGSAVIQVASETLTITEGSTDLFSAPISSLGSVSVQGGDDDDSITLDLASDPIGGLILDGGDGMNSLIVLGDSADFSSGGSIGASNFDSIDMSDANPSVIAIDAASVAAMAPNSKTILVVGGEDDVIDFKDAADWRLTEPADNGQFLLTITNQQTSEVVQYASATPWQNPIQASDVDNGGTVTAGDALRIINELGRRLYSDGDTQQLDSPDATETWPGTYYDQNGDGNATALDALRVINELARLSNSGEQIEGELTSAHLLQSATSDDTATSEATITLENPASTLAAETKLMSFDSPRGEHDSSDAGIKSAKNQADQAWSDRVDQLLSDDSFVECWK